jgi:hypothetical protein
VTHGVEEGGFPSYGITIDLANQGWKVDWLGLALESGSPR